MKESTSVYIMVNLNISVISRSIIAVIASMLFSGILTVAKADQIATTTVGGKATLYATANGSAPFTYQWKKNNVDISGATGPTYNISNFQVGDA